MNIAPPGGPLSGFIFFGYYSFKIKGSQVKKILDSFFFYLGYVSIAEVAKQDDRLTIRLCKRESFFCLAEPVVDYAYHAASDSFSFRRRFGGGLESVCLEDVSELFVSDFAGNIVIDGFAEKQLTGEQNV